MKTTKKPATTATPEKPEVKPDAKTKATPKKEKKVKEKKPTMSAIMNPMMLSGKHTLDEVVDAVAKEFKVKDLTKLRRQIAGPRLANLRLWAEKNKKPMPGLKPVEKKKEEEKK